MSDNEGAKVVEDENGNLITDPTVLSKEDMAKAGEEAMTHLAGFIDKFKAAATEDQAKAALPPDLAGELKKVISMLSAMLKPSAPPDAKDADKDDDLKKGDDASSKILAALDDLKKLLTKEPTKKEDVKPDAEPDVKPATDLEPVAKAFEKLATAVGEQANQIAEIRKSHPGSNAVAVEGDGEPPDEFRWPYDMSRAVRDEATE